MFYVCCEDGILAECSSLEEAQAVIERLGFEDVWISCDEE